MLTFHLCRAVLLSRPLYYDLLAPRIAAKAETLRHGFSMDRKFPMSDMDNWEVPSRRKLCGSMIC